MNSALNTSEAIPCTFKLMLTEREVRQLFEKAGVVGMTAGQLMECFAADLTGSANSHGYDGREYIGRWFDEILYSNDKDSSLLSYLLIEGEYDRFVDCYENLLAFTDENFKLAEDRTVSNESRSEQMAFWEKRINEAKSELLRVYDDYCEYNVCHGSYEDELSAVMDYRSKVAAALIAADRK